MDHNTSYLISHMLISDKFKSGRHFAAVGGYPGISNLRRATRSARLHTGNLVFTSIIPAVAVNLFQSRGLGFTLRPRLQEFCNRWPGSGPPITVPPLYHSIHVCLDTGGHDFDVNYRSSRPHLTSYDHFRDNVLTNRQIDRQAEMKLKSNE
ncbi:hypothetical protein J6590_033174 [Homalodisca vitripennis]|nr:hypothetical protein J6590_033174 [Homalodisca vitripennis]